MKFGMFAAIALASVAFAGTASATVATSGLSKSSVAPAAVSTVEQAGWKCYKHCKKRCKMDYKHYKWSKKKYRSCKRWCKKERCHR